MRRPKKDIQLTSYDELLGLNETPEKSMNQVVEIDLEKLYPFKNHPFHVNDDEKMAETVESIKTYGVLTPALVRPRSEGGYEMISGHRRKRGCELCGKTTMPALVRNYTDDEAVIIMVDSNIQRENLLPSEKAHAYKMKYDAMKHRMSLSIKNRWLDSEDRVYIIFTVEEIVELMNCGTQKAVKLVKELDSSNGIGLIEKKRLGLGKPNVIYVKNFMIREVPDQKPTGNCADLQSEQEDHKKIADLQSKQERHKECADLQQEAENKGKTGISLNCENHHSGVVKTTIQDYGESQFQNSENHNSRMVETTNPEFPESQFQNSENHHSRIVEITNPECPKSQSNNTDINKTDISETEINQSYPIISGNSQKKKDVMEEMRAYREVIHENIDYQYHAKEDVDELVELMIEVMMMPEDSMIRIAGVEKPVALVKSRFMKLNYSHIEYVLFCLNRNTTKVGNIKAYLLTALYNAPATINSYYQAEVNHDMYGG